MNLSLLYFAIALSCCAATLQMNYRNYELVPIGQQMHRYPAQVFLPNYQPQQQPQRTQIPTVEVQQITPEWVCNNYATGEVKYFGVKDIVTSRLSSSEVEQLLKNIPVQQTNPNPNVNPVPPINPNNPFITQNPTQNQQPNTPTVSNTDGIGVIEPRIAK